MSTTSFTPIDFDALTQELQEFERLRTLCEIYTEVGFPFTARAVGSAGPTVDQLPVGTEITFVKHPDQGVIVHGHPNQRHTELFMDGIHDRYAVDGTIPRWILLGHK